MTSDRTGRSRSRYSTFAIILISAAALFGATAARHGGEDPPSPWTRTEEEAPPPVDPEEAFGRAEGWEEPGERPAPRRVFSEFLLTHTDAQVVVTGPVAHTVVTQTWENPNREPVDGLYVFPLPENAAVTDLTLRIGTRRIEGVMRRREEARALYEKARAEGRVTALLDQERPNVFAQQVANIMPGMRIEVTIELDQEVRCDDGDCAYVLPTVVGPRFIPARQADPGRIAPPVAHPLATGQGLSFRIEVDAGMPVRELRSVNHPMRFSADRDERMTGNFSGRGAERLDRDVEVRWRLGGREPEFGVLAWRDAGESRGPGVFTLYVAPPIGGADDALAAPRELVFVLDCSGSMSGQPIEAAKDVVRQALDAARPGDTLQILRFSDRASGLWPMPVAATPANVRRALDYLDTLHGEGGTEMLSGIRAALDPPADPERLRLVAFLTDGYIGNEAEILGEVRRRLGEGRIFAFGIGSSVNRYLLENLAQEGRGAAAFLGPRETPDAMVRRFVERIETPVFTDLQLSWEGVEVDDQEPAAIPDLFAGQPLVVHGHYDRPGSGAVVLEGMLRGRRVTLRRAVTLPAAAADHEALARLWARARIDRLTRESYGSLHPDTVEKVTDLGLRLHLMTPYTSLVAVDRVVSNTRGGSTPVDVPVELPSGVSYEGIFGEGEAKALGYGGVAGARTRTQVAAAPPSLPILGRNHQDVLKVSPGVAGGMPSEGDIVPRVKERVEEASGGPAQAPPKPTPAAGVAFLQLVLVEEDGTRRIVESDGEAWIEGSGRRRLVRTLTADQLAAVAAALDAASTEAWEAGDATWARGRARIVLVTPGGMTRSRALALLDARPGALLALLRAATS